MQTRSLTNTAQMKLYERRTLKVLNKSFYKKYIYNNMACSVNFTVKSIVIEGETTRLISSKKIDLFVSHFFIAYLNCNSILSNINRDKQVRKAVRETAAQNHLPTS